MTTETEGTGAEKRRYSWGTAQKARRDRMRLSGKTLLRVWCTEAEAAAVKEAIRQVRRAARLKELLRLGEAVQMTRHRST